VIEATNILAEWLAVQKPTLTIGFCLFFTLPTFATTWIVQHGPGGHFSQVQEAIDSSSTSDTILVEPGVYYENINFIGKNIVLTSRYLFSQDTDIINNTILDGNGLGRVVTIESGESRSAQLNGFTIQHGMITRSSEHPGVRYGAGIYISESSPRITNCSIINNTILNGGSGAGIGIQYNSSPFFSNLSIHSNRASRGGGGIAIGYLDNYPEWDQIDKCSIYGNFAGYKNDINIGENYSSPILIALDTFSVSEPTNYYTGLPEVLTLTVEHGYFQPVNHDLYVSPEGNDSYSGLSFSEPLRTIQYALALIESDSLSPHTIHLDAGLFKLSERQHFPLNMKDFISLKGAGKYQTVLDGENASQLITARYNNHYKVSDMTLQHAAYGGSDQAITITENIMAIYRNLCLRENDGGVINMIGNGAEEFSHPPNSSILLDSLEIIDNTCRWTMYLGKHNSAIFQNSIIRNSQPVYDEVMDAFINYPLQLTPGLPHQPNPLTMVRNVEISNNANMSAFYPGIATAIYVDGVEASLINCTIIDNHSTTGAAVTLFNAKVSVINSIIYNNEPNQFYLYNPLPYSNDTLIIQNSIVENGEYGISEQGENSVNWLENNLDIDPWFEGDDPNPYELAANSPAIDAGTALFVWEEDTIVNMDPDEYIGLAPDIGAYEYRDPDAVDNKVVPEGFVLYPNFPNPFNGSTQITFSIPASNRVELIVYNLKGQQVSYQSFKDLDAGVHHATWDAGDLPSGVYLFEIISGDLKLSSKALLVK